jgi:hypothetical protein
MVCTVRIPDYDDPQLEQSAKTTFSMLLISHFVLAVANYVKVFIDIRLVSLMPIMMLLFIVQIAKICGGWVYNEQRFIAEKTEK